jgi:chromosome segregation ATPase
LVEYDLDITNQLLEESKAESKEQQDAYTRNMDRILRRMESLDEKLGAELRAINKRHAKCKDTENELTKSIVNLKATIRLLETANETANENNRILNRLHEECTGHLEGCSDSEAMCHSDLQECDEFKARG